MKSITAKGTRLEQLKQLATILASNIDTCEDCRALPALTKQYRETIRAVDLVDAGYDTERLTFACYSHIISKPHSADAIMLCSKMVEPLDHPEKKEYTFGMTRRTLTDRQVENMGRTNLLDESASAAEKYSQNTINQLFAYKKTNDERVSDISGGLTGALTKLGDLQDQVDGNITSWFYEGTPTGSNAPAKDWTTDALKKEHVGDLYYDTKQGLSYRWVQSGSTYKWQVIRDTSIAKALADAAGAQAAADSKVRCFVTTPTPPYDRGDIWMQGSSGDILRCQTFKYAGETFAASDWVKASKYTDDSLAKSVEDGLATATKKITSIQTQVDGKVETWYYSGEPTASNPPASSWTDDATRKLHIGDLYYNLANGRCYHWTQNGSSWRWELVRDADIQEALTQAKDAQEAADGKIRCFTTTPYPPYDVGDLWVQGSTGDIMRCQTTRTSGSYNANDWVRASKYTDDTVANEAKQDAAEAAKTATNFITFNDSDGMIVGHKNLAGKKVQITNDGVKVMDGNCMVSIRSNGISITDGSGSCSIDSGSITFRGLKNKHLFWENASPKSDFAAQTLSLPDIASYQVILIEFCDNVSGWWSNTQVPEPHIFVVGAGHAQRATFSWNTGHVRFVQVFKNGNVQFWPGAVVAKNILTGVYEHSTDNSACVPYRIYGFL